MDLWYSSAVISPRAKRSLRISSAESRGASSRSSLRTLGKIRTTNHATMATSPPKNIISNINSGSQSSSSGPWLCCSRRVARTPPAGPQPIHEVPHVIFVAPLRRCLMQDFVGLHVLFGGDFAPSEPLSEDLLCRACPLAPSRGQEPRHTPRRHRQKTCQN